ncbi:MAG: phospho-sugar mutase [Eubacterium sp.]|nr:phospho-sugar mutase [Eubacterium sp.]
MFDDYMDRYKEWFTSGYVEEDNILEELDDIRGNEAEIKERFCETLDFGTAGLRGIMRAGLNGMNVYTVRLATQALADVINTCGEDQGAGVTIAFDSRINSKVFAREAAMVLAANGIHVNIWDDLRPTPELSYAIRETGSIAGINITASHNPKEYNGYKVYWSDGAQLTPEKAATIKERMDSIHIFNDVKMLNYGQACRGGFITALGEEIDKKYIDEVLNVSLGRKYVEQVGDEVTIIYTPLHGADHKMVPQVLRELGLKNVIPVHEQMELDGTFPTVRLPNPGEPSAFKLALEYAEDEDADLIIGTDPDGDRMGMMVKDGDKYTFLNGNQIACLMLDYIIGAKQDNGTLAPNSAVVRSLVSSPLADRICEAAGVSVYEVPTGFKYIGEKMEQWQASGSHTFLFGFEESNGFLTGMYARDKDGVVASMLAAEMACFYKAKGMTIIDALNKIYEKYGYYKEKTISVDYKNLHEAEPVIARIRENPPTEVVLKVESVKDFLPLDKVNVIKYNLEDNCALVIRPSGTEPKIKVYALVKADTKEAAGALAERVAEAGKALL